MDSARINVMIVDDVPQIRDYFMMVINNEAGMKAIGCAATGEEAVIQAGLLRPDVILMDIQMERDTAGIDAIAQIKFLYPDIKCIVLTMHSDDENIMNAYVAGAVDFVAKTASIVEVIMAIKETITNTETRQKIARKVADEMVRLRKERDSLFYVVNLISRLTTSEFEVLRAVYNGEKYKEIAQKRCVEEATVRSLVNKILTKLESKNMRVLVENLKRLHIMEDFDKYSNKNPF